MDEIVEASFKIFKENLEKEGLSEGKINLGIKRLNEKLFERSSYSNSWIIYDIIKGYVNNQLFFYNNNKFDKIIEKEIIRWIENIHKEARIKIWNARCDKVKNLEKNAGIIIDKKICKKVGLI
jgi:hypothetical protein